MANKSNMILAEALERASAFLRDAGHEGASAQAYWGQIFDCSLTDMVRQMREPVAEEAWTYYKEVLTRLVGGEPLQYILGRADFMGESFKVTPDTLIPREETAGLIELARPFLTAHPRAQVLDIGTGSGIIAIMVQKLFPDTQVMATDISKEALAVAQENAEAIGVEVQWREADLFQGIETEAFDLILSNPPYIGSGEIPLMDAHVLNYEPAQALFADQEGYGIYERLAQDLPTYLKPGGQAIFEIGFQQGEGVRQLMARALPGRQIEVRQDFNNLDRYIHIKGEEGSASHE